MGTVVGLSIPAIAAGAAAGAAAPQAVTPLAAARLAAPAPTNVRAVDTTTSSVTVAWTPPAGATRYRVLIADNAKMTDRRRVATRNTRHTLTGLSAGANRWVRVRVIEMSGEPAAGTRSPILKVTAASGGTATAPLPGSGETLFGANYTSTADVDETVYGGRAEAARVFFQQLDGKSFSKNGPVKEALADGIDTFVVSWRETDLAAIRTFLAGIPDGLTVYTSFNHEPENDAGAAGTASYDAWATEFRRQWKLQSPLMRAEGFIPTTILMQYTLAPSSGRDIADWTPPQGTVDVFAFDSYLTGDVDPAKMVDRMTEAARAAGVPRTGIAETGSPADDPDRVARTRALRNEVIAAGGFDFALYWNAVDRYDHRMDKKVSDAWFG
ncbi:fibronectin type III domain-containing protein [Nocardioides sp. YIM 152588]|uniref:fibronectin type III domain-containing protein n=1 Tax=Nocardioides sp. YIM 152588 TaxID=3158259 RepID=UPI0032E4CD26